MLWWLGGRRKRKVYREICISMERKDRWRGEIRGFRCVESPGLRKMFQRWRLRMMTKCSSRRGCQWWLGAEWGNRVLTWDPCGWLGWTRESYYSKTNHQEQLGAGECNRVCFWFWVCKRGYWSRVSERLPESLESRQQGGRGLRDDGSSEQSRATEFAYIPHTEEGDERHELPEYLRNLFEETCKRLTSAQAQKVLEV